MRGCVCARAYARTRGNQRDEPDPGASTLRQTCAPLSIPDWPVVIMYIWRIRSLPTPNCPLDALPCQLDAVPRVCIGRDSTGRLPRGGKSREDTVEGGEGGKRGDLPIPPLFYRVVHAGTTYPPESKRELASSSTQASPSLLLFFLALRCFSCSTGIMV